MLDLPRLPGKPPELAAQSQDMPQDRGDHQEIRQSREHQIVTDPSDRQDNKKRQQDDELACA